MSNKQGKDEMLKEMTEALWVGDAEKLRDLLRCPMTRAEMLVEAFKMAFLKDPAVTSRKVQDDFGYRRGVYKPKWNNSPTRTIRVPLKFARDILAFAHRVDKGKLNPADILDEGDYALASPDKNRQG